MNKFLSMLGLGLKANIIKPGEFKTEMEIKKNNCKLIILANDASKNTKEKFQKMSIKKNIELIEYGDKEYFGNALGKSCISIIAVVDDKFSQELKKLI